MPPHGAPRASIDRVTITSRALDLALLGLPPHAIAEKLGRSGDSVRSLLSRVRASGIDIPKRTTAPARPVLPQYQGPLFRPDEQDRIDGEIATLAAASMPQRRIAKLLDLSLGYVQRSLARSKLEVER